MTFLLERSHHEAQTLDQRDPARTPPAKSKRKRTGFSATVPFALAAALFLLAPGRSWADVPLTLSDAIAHGLKSNPALAAARAEVDAASARKMMASSALYPQLSLSETYMATDNPMYAFGTRLNQQRVTAQDFNPDLLNDPDNIHNWNTALTLSWLLFDGGRSWVSVAQADQDRQARRLLLRRAEQEVINQVVTTYAQVLYAGENLRVVDQALDAARAHQSTAQSLYETGTVVRSDYLRAEVRVAELEQQKISAENHEAMARASLNAAMGADQGLEFDLTGLALSGCVAGEGPEARGVDEWVRTALEKRTDLQAARIYVDLSGREIDKSRLAFMPSIFVSNRWEADSEDFDEQAYSQTTMAVASIDLFTGLRHTAEVDQAQAMSARAQSMKTQLAQGVELETRQAFLDLRSSCRGAEVARASVNQAEEGYRIVNDRYRSGLYTIVVLLDAESALQAVRNAEVATRRDYTVARSRLFLAAGVLEEDFQ